MISSFVIAVSLCLGVANKPCSGCSPCVCKVCDCESKYDALQKDVWLGRERWMIVGNMKAEGEFGEAVRFPSGYLKLDDGLYKCFNKGGKWMIRHHEVVTPKPDQIKQENVPVVNWSLPLSTPACKT